ncbi:MULTISPECIES: acyltransferase [Pseudomonas]|jgi:acetyltransferase-like isoleucine patch superfamily enzyme|uniref:Chloramphenicol acetyltransferase n=1 Tax=Pseudomonas fluorescens TaxID=294 RepID=A0A4Y9TNJ7_PSEFL|nr:MULTISPECIES: acyltransferase [Pseudomonas]MCX9154173.1 acyltransferase [Pseudomonas sp. TB1-B1]TFW45000.1 acyltransferase [Pseudomonas fluorescens]TKJ65644.1 acyltransferase [Pseudomonas sp. CFBP13506]CRM96137.1 putative lipopolysaccharide biosynthesis O-acetyl transferase WbbJ [Pseudomonas sp. 22 E 5]
MAFLTEAQLKEMGFKHLGKNVKISDKASLYNCDRISIGDNTRIDDFCMISGTVTLGRNVHIAVFSNVAGGEPGVTMEDFSGLAYGCQVFAQSDDYSGKTLTNPTVPNEYKAETKSAIYIGRHVIIGTHSIVLPGVNLAEGCSVGAMSMVTKSTEEWGIYFGVPAKRIKNRSRQLLDLEAKYLASEIQ